MWRILNWRKFWISQWGFPPYNVLLTDSEKWQRSHINWGLWLIGTENGTEGHGEIKIFLWNWASLGYRACCQSLRLLPKVQTILLKNEFLDVSRWGAMVSCKRFFFFFWALRKQDQDDKVVFQAPVRSSAQPGAALWGPRLWISRKRKPRLPSLLDQVPQNRTVWKLSAQPPSPVLIQFP